MFSEEALYAIFSRYPGLKKIGPETIEGILNVNASYRGQRLVDVFTIRIEARNPLSDYLPGLYEIGGRTEFIAKKWGLKDFRDLHRNNAEGTVCLCVKQEEEQKFPLGSDLMVFIEKLVIPYFFGLVHFEEHNEWPWGDFSHGVLGLFEYYADPKSTFPTLEEIDDVIFTIQHESNNDGKKTGNEYLKQIRRPSAKRLCPCGNSRRAFEDCHGTAWKGLKNFRNGMVRLRIYPSLSIFDLA